MHGELDTKGLRFSLIFTTSCLALVFFVRTASSAGFDTYFSNAYRNVRSAFYSGQTMNSETGPTDISAGAYSVALLGADDPEAYSRPLAQKNFTKIYPIASLTKLMTALLVYEDIDLHNKVVISQDDAGLYPEADFEAGDQWTAGDLLYPMLMDSSNDAAQALAEAYPQGSSSFVAEMNIKAKEIGMSHSHFSDSTGLSDQDVSSVDDILRLVGYIEANEPNIFALTKIKNKMINTENTNTPVRSGSLVRVHDFTNTNVFGDDPSFLGGKTGYTDAADETMVSLFRYRSWTAVLVVLDSSSRIQDINALLAWLKR